MDSRQDFAEQLIKDYKKDNYVFGFNCLEHVGTFALQFGREALLIISQRKWANDLREKVFKILKESDINILAISDTSRENSPKEDVFKLADLIKKTKPNSIICVGGGSAIDTAKAANVLAVLDPDNCDLEKFFGEGKVSEELNRRKIDNLYPLIAVQVSAGSGSHISKYSNITDMVLNQKKLIIDNAIIPPRAIFDYTTTVSMPEDLTKDGALDGFSHCLEVYYGYDENNKNFRLVEDVCLTGISLIVDYLPELLKNLRDLEKRKMIGLATDLGGYAIMLHGTNGAHLNSFSFVDVLSHGRACAIMNPYYTVFFSNKIENKLKKIALIYKDYLKTDVSSLKGKELGIAVAKAMTNFAQGIGFPTKLEDVKGFTDKHIERAVSAAKDPQLESKLKNMPVSLTSSEVEDYIKPVLMAAKTGNFEIIKLKD